MTKFYKNNNTHKTSSKQYRWEDCLGRIIRVLRQERSVKSYFSTTSDSVFHEQGFNETFKRQLSKHHLAELSTTDVASVDSESTSSGDNHYEKRRHCEDHRQVSSSKGYI